MPKETERNTGASCAMAEQRRRRTTVVAAAVTGAGLLAASMQAPAGSRRFYGQTFGVAAIWAGGGFVAGPLPLATSGRRRPVVLPVLLGVGMFGIFYGAALVARRIPILNRAIGRVLGYAHRGSPALTLATTLANGAAEEVLFRGAVYAQLGDCSAARRVALSTSAYALATTATANPALVLASVVLGTVFAVQREATGGIQAPVLTHLTWSALMLRFLPPLFEPPERQSCSATS
jgi:membrane protease YdiL (CAAX protease family)